ncbi:MAG: Fe-S OXIDOREDUCTASE, partial [uncultured Thiotrichaceae bacterium]
YFIAAHPGTTDEDMLNLALWLKKHDFRADQVQAFYPSPMATATTMYHTGKNPLQKVTYKSDQVETVKSPEQRKLHKALLRYHDPANWALIRARLKEMGRAELIGDGPNQLIPEYTADEKQLAYQSHRRKNSAVAHKKRTGGKGNVAKQKQGGAAKTKHRNGKNIRTQHTGLPPLAEDETDQKPKQNASAKHAKRSKPRRKKKPTR